MDDKRFAHIAKDPKFRRIPKGRSKVKIDKRFQSMFKDKKFDVTHKIDKRGRPVKFETTANLKKFYELNSEDDENSDNGSDHESGEVDVIHKSQEKPIKSKKKKQSLNEDDKEEENSIVASESEEDDDKQELHIKDKSDKQLSDEIKKKLKDVKMGYARGKARLISESSSDDEEDETENESEDDGIEHQWGELDKDAETTEEATHRIAACNMDWDRIRAIDLMVLFNSFLPQGGVIKSVAIYPSEFGKERMKEEEIKGPIELVEHDEEEIEEDNEEGSKYHMEKLRKYQLNRLKYYYAVVTFDNPNSANRIYTECDGMEYESSATKLDLRFIPDDMTFDDGPKEFCDKLPELNKYQPRFFTTTALQQAKVDLTWDETDLRRTELVKKFSSGKIEDITEEDLRDYIASSSSDDDDNDEKGEIEENFENDVKDNQDSISKYRALLQEIEENKSDDNEDEGMEMTWDLGLQEKTNQLVKKKIGDEEDKTPFQKYLDKRKEKRKEKKKLKKNDTNSDHSDVPSDIDMNDPYFAEEFNKSEFKKSTKKQNKKGNIEEVEDNPELDLLLMNEDDGKQHFSLKKIQEEENVSNKRKKKKKAKQQIEEKQDDFQVDVQDERFSALFTSHLYNIDPTDPHYKKTKGMEVLINEKLKRRIEEKPEENSRKVKDAQLNALVKSVKRKKIN